MKLKKTTDYAIRVVLYLAEKNDICTSLEISVHMGIPQNYLNKIIRQLREAGIIISYQGTKGGFKLMKKANEISLFEVVNEFEGGLDYKEKLSSMVNENNSSLDMKSVQDSLNAIFAKMESKFKEMTIEDLLQGNKKSNHGN